MTWWALESGNTFYPAAENKTTKLVVRIQRTFSDRRWYLTRQDGCGHRPTRARSRLRNQAYVLGEHYSDRYRHPLARRYPYPVCSESDRRPHSYSATYNPMNVQIDHIFNTTANDTTAKSDFRDPVNISQIIIDTSSRTGQLLRSFFKTLDS